MMEPTQPGQPDQLASGSDLEKVAGTAENSSQAAEEVQTSQSWVSEPYSNSHPGVCSVCGREYEEVPGHTGGDDYYGGIGEACTVWRCGCGKPAA
jgi:hypothetical protein